MGIAELEAVLQAGQRANKYRLNFTLPTGVSGTVRDLSVLVKSTSLPGTTEGQIEIKREGLTRRLKGDEVTDATWNVVLQIPSKSKDLFKTFYDWKALVKDYKVTMSVDLLDMANVASATFNVEGCWVVTIPAVAPDSDSSDTIMELDITLSADKIGLV